MTKDKGTVVFDLDGVVGDFESHFASWIERENIHDLPMPDKTQHSLGYNPAQFAQLHDSFARAGEFLSMPVYTDTLEVLKTLAGRGYRLRYFTARQSFTGHAATDALVQHHTRKWLRKIDAPDSERLSFCGKSLKCQTFLTLGAIAMVEDHLETAVDISRLYGPPPGLPVKSFLVDRLWNRHQKYPFRLDHISALLPHFP